MHNTLFFILLQMIIPTRARTNVLSRKNTITETQYDNIYV